MSLAIPRRGGTLAMPGPTMPGLRIAAIASLGAGAVHAAAAGVHAEHPDLARIFIVLAAAQLGAGVLALLRPTRVAGISWIDGLQTRETAQFADTVCAGLGALAAASALAAVLIGWQRDDADADAAPAAPSTRTVLASAAPIIAIAALTVPAMLFGGTHTNAHDDASAAHDHGTEAA